MEKNIHFLKINNFKSIDALELTNLGHFMALAGPNGSGKSNFFDALAFVAIFIRNGIEAAINTYGGYGIIHSEKRRKDYARQFDFEIQCSLLDANQKKHNFDYRLSIGELDVAIPRIEESLKMDGTTLLSRKRGELPRIFIDQGANEQTIPQFPPTHSALLLFQQLPIVAMLSNVRLYRIEPSSAKQTSPPYFISNVLEVNGQNLPAVLNKIEGNDAIRQTIMEWMETIVPGIEKIQTEQQKLDSKTAVLFKEKGTRKQFPAHMISDGTIYALCLLVAILEPPPYGWTLIEEPERGLHPYAIQELTNLMRDQSSANHAIWLSTHSESVVRSLRPAELMLIDKRDGRTKMRCADAGNLTQETLIPLTLDEAWLSNLLNGGVPW